MQRNTPKPIPDELVTDEVSTTTSQHLDDKAITKLLYKTNYPTYRAPRIDRNISPLVTNLKFKFNVEPNKRESAPFRKFYELEPRRSDTPTTTAEASLAQHAIRQLAQSISREFSFEDEVFEYLQDEDIRPNWMPCDYAIPIKNLISVLSLMVKYAVQLEQKQRITQLITAPQPVMVYNPFFATPILNIAALSSESVLRDIILLSLLVNTPILRCITQSFTPILILCDHHYSNAPTEQFTPFFNSIESQIISTFSTPDSEVDTTRLKYRK